MSKATLHKKCEQRLESQEAFEEKIRRVRSSAAEVQQTNSWYREQARQQTRVKFKQEEEKRSLDPGRRYDVVEDMVRHKHLTQYSSRTTVEPAAPHLRLNAQRKLSQSIRAQADREKRLQHAREALEREQQAWEATLQEQQVQVKDRCDAQREEVQRLQAELKLQRDAAKNGQSARGKQVRQATVENSFLREEAFEISLGPGLLAQVRPAAPENQQRVRNLVNGSQFNEQQRRRQEAQRLREDKARCASHDVLVRTLELQERRYLMERAQRQVLVEQRQVQSARTHREQWDKGREKRWGQRDFSLDRSDGDIPTKTLIMTQTRQRSP
jgi:hypothetical protein